MYFAVYALDHPGRLDVRVAHRDAHRQRLRAPDFPVTVVLAGPLLDDAQQMAGSLLVIDALSIETVRDFMGADPYQLNGLYASVDIRPFSWTIGAPETI